MQILKVIGLLMEYPDELLWECKEDALALIRRDFGLGLYGEGAEAVAERDRLLAEAHRLHGAPAESDQSEAA